jgi:hypothetical protein
MHSSESARSAASTTRAAADIASPGTQAVAYPAPRVLFGEGFNALSDPEVENDPGTFFGRDQYSYPSLGFTTKVHDFEGPDIDFQTEELEENEDYDAGWYATPKRNGYSDIGENDSWALGQGDHIVPGLQENAKPVHAIISNPMAVDILAAEQEHVNDYEYAFDEIMDKADDWLNDEMKKLGDGGEFGPAESSDEAIELVEKAIDPALKAHLGLVGVNDFGWANVGSYYRKAADQTEERDENDWHSFGRNEAELGDRVNHTITAGTTEIGAHPSSEVIDLSQVQG